MDSEPTTPLDADAAIEAIDAVVAELERVIGGAPAVVPDELDRARVADAARRQLYNLLALVGWRLLDELYARDGQVLWALREMEQERGVAFVTTGEQVARTAGVPISSTYAGLHRLQYLGLIRWQPGRGASPGRVQIEWARFQLCNPAIDNVREDAA